MKKLKNIIFITGTGRCGSTMLDMMLGTHSDVVGFGEIRKVLFHPYKDKEDIYRIWNKEICSCGRTRLKCQYWSKFFPIQKSLLGKNNLDKYISHYEYFQKLYGGKKIMVDSSKNLNHLKELMPIIDDKSNQIVILIKDVRGYTYSMSKKFNRGWILKFITFWWGWYRGNKRIIKYFSKHKLTTTKVGYEEMAFYPEFILKLIIEKMNKKFNIKCIPPPKNSNSHISAGNFSVRTNKSKQSKIFYDYRWFMDTSLNSIAFLLPQVMKFNSKHTYSNHLIENNFYSKSKK